LLQLLPPPVPVWDRAIFALARPFRFAPSQGRTYTH